MNIRTRLDSVRRRLATQLRSTRGAIDLVSIMVGIIVIGIVGATITAVVVHAIPWTQGRAAAASLDSVRIAQNVYRGMGEGLRFGTLDELYAANVLQKGGTVAAATGSGGACWVAVSPSPTGKTYWAGSENPSIRELKSGDTADCANIADLADSVRPVEAIVVGSSSELQAAFANAHSGSLIRAGRDWTGTADDTQSGVPIGKSFTLDLAGKTVSLTGSGDGGDVATAGIALPLGAELTIKDSVGGGVLNVAGGENAAGIGASGSPYDPNTDQADFAFGKLHLLSGKVVAVGGRLAPAVGGTGSPQVGPGEGGLIEIRGGELHASGAPGDVHGTAVGGEIWGLTIRVSGGVLTANGTGMGNAITVGPNGVMAVSGGAVKVTTEMDGAGISLDAPSGAFPDLIALSISGGSVEASSGTRGAGIGYGTSGTGAANVRISGGTITAQNGPDYWASVPAGLDGFGYAGATPMTVILSGHPTINGRTY